jgi:hypothetical protein
MEGSNIDSMKGLSSKEVAQWRAQWSVALSSLVRKKTHHFWIIVESDRSVSESKRIFGSEFSYPQCMLYCGVVDEASEPKSCRSLFFQ